MCTAACRQLAADHQQHACTLADSAIRGYQILPTEHVQQLKCVARNAHTSDSHHQRTCRYLKPSPIKKIFDYHYCNSYLQYRY